MSDTTPSDQSSGNRFVTQTVALVVDAYREVNGKKLFWITLILSLLVVGIFAFVGINERGVKIFTWTIPGIWNTSIIPADQFYKWMFTTVAIPWWLGFLATILALISVCSMFPDLLSGGSIDLYLARPIARARLFVTKYLLGLSFAAMQVAVFSIASFLVIGLRGGSWEWKVFLAIPLVTLFFSYLYCICVLVGIVTRSSLAALLITALFWGGVIALNTTDSALLMFKSMMEERYDNQQRLIDYNKQLLDRNGQMPSTQRSNSTGIGWQNDIAIKRLDELGGEVSDIRWWYQLIRIVKAPMPKTDETVALMSRWMVDPTPFDMARAEGHRKREERRARMGFHRDPDRIGPDDEGVMERVEDELSSRAAVKIIGTSLGFEAVIVLLAAWVFCRRDY